MNQNVFSKKTFIAATCIATLAGCLDDPYQGTTESSSVVSGDATALYSTDSDGTYALSVIDSTDTEALVDDSGNVSQGNIETKNISGEENSTLNVSITDDDKGRILLQSSDGSNINLDIDASTATLQFENRAITKASLTQDIYLTMQEEAGTDIGKVSLTSSFLAGYNAATQTVKVPLSCFTDSGMDFTNLLSPFVLESSTNISFDIGNISLVEDSITEDDVLECDSTSSPLAADDSDDAYSASELFVLTDWTLTGWATAITTWMTSGTIDQGWAYDHITITYSDVSAGENGGLVLTDADGTARDLSNYIDSGVLQFMFYVSDYADHPTQRFQVQMESSDFGNSQAYYLDAGTADNSWVQVQVPLTDLFTRDDGSININAAKNIDKGLSILPEWIDDSDTLQDMAFSIGSIQLVIP